MPSPGFRLVCCLCRNTVARSAELCGLDEEWQRRFPRMAGTLACRDCVFNPANFWRCDAPSDLAEGHIPADNPQGCIDSYSHICDRGMQAAMVRAYPLSGLMQGAEDYLRWVASHQRGDEAEYIRDELARWDARS